MCFFLLIIDVWFVNLGGWGILFYISCDYVIIVVNVDVSGWFVIIIVG